jgi:hypothetical protein
LEHHPQGTAQAVSGLVSHGVNVAALHVRLWNGFLEDCGIKIPVKTQEEFESLCIRSGFVEVAFSRRKNR